MSLSESAAIVRRYVEAWNAHDAAAIVASFAPGGTYQDPVTQQPIGGAALQGFTQACLDAISETRFDYRIDAVSDTLAYMTWIWTGRHTGAFNGIPPTNQPVRVEGVDVVTLDAAGVKTIVGYYDSAEVLRQLGMKLVPQPA